MLVAELASAPAVADRWSLEDAGGIRWDVGAGLPHADHLEMSGRRVSLIVRYSVGADRVLALDRTVVYPTLRTIPNNTHASLLMDHGDEASPTLRIHGRESVPRVERVFIDGLLRFDCRTDDGLRVTRTIFPSRRQRSAVERWCLRNDARTDLRVEISPLLREDRRTGVYGEYVLDAISTAPASVALRPGEERDFALIFTGRLAADAPLAVDPAAEEAARREYVKAIFAALRLETPDPVLDREFDFAKLRAAESIFETKGGLMHGPGGGAYYAAVWANDQAEYAGPFFPFLGDEAGNEASLNCYRLFARYMHDDYKPIPSSIIAEGVDVWAGAGDRGDAAMIAYGAPRFALALGDRATAEELWPAVQWCLEYCRRKTTAAGVVASDSDELEGRFPSGKANLSTSSLAYGGLRAAADLARALGKDPALADEYDSRAATLRAALESYFGADVDGFHTYRYYDGNTVLRAWICLPLTMGIFDRAPGTIAALFSPRLWTADGLATEAGQPTFWDRSTLYALRGVLFAGETETAMKYLRDYTRRRLLGDHVPYAVEAYPEGNQRHLSAESALYCRVLTEGLFGLIPTGLECFTCAPRLPVGWDRMALRDVKAFGRSFDLVAEREGERTRVSVEEAGRRVWTTLWDARGPIAVDLGPTG